MDQTAITLPAFHSLILAFPITRFQTSSLKMCRTSLRFSLSTLKQISTVYLNMVAVNLSCALRRQINRVCDGHHKPGDSHPHQLSHLTIALLVVGKQMEGSKRPTKRWYAWSERMLRKTGDRRTYEGLTINYCKACLKQLGKHEIYMKN